MSMTFIFYQFDEGEFRKNHYGKGWFDYHSTPFGYWCGEPEAVIKELEQIVKSCYTVSNEYLREHRETFTLYDKHNSDRIYKILKERAMRKG